MIIAGRYSFKDGAAFVEEHFDGLLAEVYTAIAAVDAHTCKTKVSREKTMPGRMLYSPRNLNRAFMAAFTERGWENKRVFCEYPNEFYTEDFKPRDGQTKGAFRELDFVKDQLGVEVQFGKYAFMVYNVCAKMTIFHNLGHISAGVEIVPIKQFANEMSTGVSYFEQFVWDLQQRGVSNIDIPVLILGIDA